MEMFLARLRDRNESGALYTHSTKYHCESSEPGRRVVGPSVPRRIRTDGGSACHRNGGQHIKTHTARQRFLPWVPGPPSRSRYTSLDSTLSASWSTMYFTIVTLYLPILFKIIAVAAAPASSWQVVFQYRCTCWQLEYFR